MSDMARSMSQGSWRGTHTRGPVRNPTSMGAMPRDQTPEVLQSPWAGMVAANVLVIEDLGRVAFHIGAVGIAGPRCRRKVLALLCFLLPVPGGSRLSTKSAKTCGRPWNLERSRTHLIRRSTCFAGHSIRPLLVTHRPNTSAARQDWSGCRAIGGPSGSTPPVARHR